MKVYDCFTFYNELDLLEIRLNELNSVVDYFVLVEAEATHQNKSKILYFDSNKHRYSQFLNKIIHVIIPKESFIEDAWYNERFQRRSILDGLKNASDDDLLVVSDLDEIPRHETLKLAIQENSIPCVFEQILHYYYLNTPLYQNENFYNYGSVLLTKKLFQTNTEMVRSAQKHQFKKISDGGWHFSFLGDNKNALNKINNYAHTEFSNITENTVNLRFEKMEDPLGRQYCKLGYNSNIDYLPTYVKNNLDKFQQYIKR